MEYLHAVAMAEDNSEEAEKEQEPGLSVADEEALHIKVSNMVIQYLSSNYSLLSILKFHYICIK